MAYAFDGANDELRNENGVSGIDVDAFTMSCLAYVISGGANQTIFMTASDISSGNYRGAIETLPPDTSGFQFAFVYSWTTSQGKWHTGDLSLDTWYHFLVTYDRGDTANNPIMYVDGVSQSITEKDTPVGTAKTGVDSVIFGENVGGGQDYDGRCAEVGFWNRILSPSEAVLQSKMMSPDFTLRGLKAYWDLIRNLNERMQGANLTLSGATVIEHPRVFKPYNQQIWTPSTAAGGAAIALDGFANSVGAVVGDILLNLQFNSVVNVSSLSTGDLRLDLKFNSLVNSVSETTSDLRLDLSLNSVSNAVSSSAGNMRLNLFLNSVSNADSSFTGDLRLDLLMAGASEGVSTVNGSVRLSIQLNSVVNAISLATNQSVPGVMFVNVPLFLNGPISCSILPVGPNNGTHAPINPLHNPGLTDSDMDLANPDLKPGLGPLITAIQSPYSISGGIGVKVIMCASELLNKASAVLL